ncbi:MAG TPA: DUF305 domain-containing protein [Gemmatimonadaceae bacterium]|nr:DUF305 domain-containing protein [Gemmatimonadaceae bacterium]
MSSVTRTISALLGACALAACGGHTGASEGAAGPTPASAQGEAAAIAKARADSIRYPYTAADVHFMQGMIGHHSQAIAMASWAPSHGASASVQRLAERIINAQQDEIATMQQWLADRRQSVPEAKAGPMKMMMNGKEQEMLMPGMLTAEQMHQLDLAKGPDFDRLFLTDMIQHHKGAVSMVQDLFGTYGAAQDELTFKFASDVNVDQTTEIARMEKMLSTFSLEHRAQ